MTDMSSFKVNVKKLDNGQRPQSVIHKPFNTRR
jgi:hypothetical protein